MGARDRRGDRRPGGRPRTYRCAGRWPSHLGRRLCILQVRANCVGHQRYRLPCPTPLQRRGRVPDEPNRGPAGHRQLRRPGIGPGGVAGRVRARRRVAHRLPAAAQGCAQACSAGVRRCPVRHPRAGQDVRPVVKTVPGAEASTLDGLATGEVGDLLSTAGAVIMVGERLATVPGGLSAAARLADATGARLAWVPRRAGERGALEAGALPGLLPGGRPLADDAARAQVCAGWHVDELPAPPVAATSTASWPAPPTGALGALLVGGIEPDDFADPGRGAGRPGRRRVRGQPRAAAQRRHRTRRRGVPRCADDPQGRGLRQLGGPLPRIRARHCRAARSKPASRITRCSTRWPTKWASIWAVPRSKRPARSCPRWGIWDGERAAAPSGRGPQPPQPGSGEAVLTGWRMLLDEGRGQDGEPHLAGDRTQTRGAALAGHRRRDRRR